MNAKTRIVLIIALALLAGATLAAVTWAAPKNSARAPGGAPTVVAYQGEVRVGGTPYTGNGYFKLAVVDALDTTYWSNDGTSSGGSEPATAVQLTVSDGLFSVLLGDTSLAAMTQELSASVFGEPDRYLRVWFSSDNATYDRLLPDTRIAAVPYALQAQEAVEADTLDGLHASELGTHYQNVVVVARSGGDYASVQAAIDSITDAAADNAYLVWVAPGVYDEMVTMKPYVHLQGAGQEATVITSATTSSAWPPDQATLVLASDTSLRDLTVGNDGVADSGTAVLATGGVTRTLVADVTARAAGSGVNSLAVCMDGAGTGVTLLQVTALAENGSDSNMGLINRGGAVAVLQGGSFTARGGDTAWGILNANGGTALEAEDVVALGENGGSSSYGLHSRDSATAELHGGSFTGNGGNDAYGIDNDGGGTTLEAESVSALAQDGANASQGLYNHAGARALLRGGSMTALGGQNTLGIRVDGSDSMLEAESVTVLAENGSTWNYGLFNHDSATAILRGGSFSARGGTEAWAIYNNYSAMLEAESVALLAEDASIGNYGLFSYNGSAAVLRGGSFTARGGEFAWGIYSDGSGTTLAAENVAALGENGGSSAIGLYCSNNTVATVRGGSFSGHGGTDAYGIENRGGSTTLDAESVTALAEDGSDNNQGLYNHDGAEALLRGSSITARGGQNTLGIRVAGSDAVVEAESTTVLAENGSAWNYGLFSDENSTAILRGGSYTARGGTDAWAIYNNHWAILEAGSVAALAEDASNGNYGLYSYNGSAATLRGGSYIARGGVDAWGIYNDGSGTILVAASVTALGENGSSSSYGLYHSNNASADVTQSILQGVSSPVYGGSGTITVSNGRLVGGAATGTVTCVLVTRGIAVSTDGSTCP